MDHIDIIKKIMADKGLFQHDLAKPLGVTRGAVGHYLAKRRRLSIKQLQDVASYLKIPLEELTSTPQPEQQHSQVKCTYDDELNAIDITILQLFKRLTKDQCIDIINIAQGIAEKNEAIIKELTQARK